MANNWTERERKLSIRARRRKQGGRFKEKENRNKTTGKQRKIYNEIRRLRQEDDNYDNSEGDDNGT